jgi:hypothetical protein
MAGPRVSSGEDSKQDYSTPADFMAAIEKRFGPVQFDLAAHAGNAKHVRYFSPKEFVHTGTAEQMDGHRGVLVPLFKDKKRTQPKRNKAGDPLFEKRTPAFDPAAYALDAFAHPWAELSAKFSAPDGEPGLLWLNCEFGDVPPWAARCLKEMADGANITLLTPVAIANWFRDHIAGRADTYLLSGRLCFDGKNVFPKDCMVSHFHRGAEGRVQIWDWQRDIVCTTGIWAPRLAA